MNDFWATVRDIGRDMATPEAAAIFALLLAFTAAVIVLIVGVVWAVS